MILKPYRLSPDNIAQDATKEIVISWANQGDRQYSYQIKIYRNSDNELIYDTEKILSVSTQSTILADTLTNGVLYKYQIIVWNQIDESATSEWIMFKCSSTPSVSFSNLLPNAQILNSSYTFQGQYTQLQNVPIMSWRMILYNNLNSIIGDTNIIFSDTPEYIFSGLNSESAYFIEVQCTSQDGLSSSSGKIPFKTKYETPPLTIALEAENNKDDASVKLLWNIMQIIGESEDTTYIDNKKIDTTNGKVWFDEGFNVDDNFTLKLWIEAVANIEIKTNPNSSVILCETPPLDNSAIWVEKLGQTSELIIVPTVSVNAPTDINSLWIENSTQATERYLDRTSIEIIKPSYLNTLWVDVFPYHILDKIEILKMKNDNDDSISLMYCNSTFYLFKNDFYQDSVSVSSSSYYIYIQQIGNSLRLHAEAI